MSTLAVTNTLSNGATVTAAEHNTNYSDIVTYVNNRNSGSSTWDAMSVSSASNVPFIANNSSGTQDIARFQDNGSNALQILDGGYVSMALQSSVRAFRNTSTQAFTGSSIKVQFNGETYDTQSEFDSVTNFRFTATKDGKYLVMSSLFFSANSGGPTVSIKVNGSTVSSFVWAYSTANSNYMVWDILSLSATDYVEIFCQATATLDNGSSKSYLCIHKVA